MGAPFKDLRLRIALAFAAFLLGSAYLGIVHHVLVGRKGPGEVPAIAGNVMGGIYAVLGVAVLWYAWKTYRRITAQKEKPGTQV